MANVWYPYDNNPYRWVSSTNNTTSSTFNVYTTWPPPAKVPDPPKGEPDPLDWLRERVDEICELSGIAA